MTDQNQSIWYNDEPFGAFWEKGYRDNTLSCMGGPSYEVIQIESVLPRKAKVLDLGCGEGRNSLFLAAKGHDVTSVDRSEAGLNKLTFLANSFSLQIKTIVSDIRNFAFEEEYDLILAHGVLYYLQNQEWKELLTTVRQFTRPGGFNVYTIFVYDNDYPCTPEIQAASYLGSFAPYEIKHFYQDWEEIFFDKYVKWDAHPGIPLHYHPIEKLISRKPCDKKFQHEVLPIFSKTIITDELFHQIPMGISEVELIEMIGKTDEIVRFVADGNQYGCSSRINPLATVNQYILELWYYGKFVIYLVNGVVDGRSLYMTEPKRLSL